jgi:alcohol dehydrogenase (cytochrome c)/quinohemoprotein ethanol dehydrogenase
LFDQYCSACHGEHAIGGGVVSDLRASNFLSMDFFYNIVLDGALKDAGMPSFKPALSRDDATAIRNFIIHRANRDSKAAAPH